MSKKMIISVLNELLEVKNIKSFGEIESFLGNKVSCGDFPTELYNTLFGENVAHENAIAA